ncbi:hypothetical protein [Gluconobacter sp. Gdi]|uniref:hypothetical protein n=1 Tax=Gluconobacter sp. Gdi TaxID=2691888 RepID=UPI00177029A0|nr:hypothetical protein [Gluconobacter sp. Gdi]GFE98079.1 hypothetical protein DmGdi_31520 [Gluconobacter sp. Gdi]
MSEDSWRKPARPDRETQKLLLKAMADAFPNHLSTLPEGYSWQDKRTVSNIVYLAEHGLCQTQVLHEMGIDIVQVAPPIITANGLDFLADDGGLRAILGVVTVRFDAETLRALLAKEVDEADIPEEEKSVIKEHLKALPEAALKAGVTDLVGVGLKHIPDSIAWLRIHLGL